MAIVRVAGLEIDQDLPFQRRSWIAQRIGWVAMAAIVAAALAGLFGSGPLSDSRSEVPGLMSVQYQRFARYETDETLTVRLEPPATGADLVRVSLAQPFLDAVTMERIQPAPARVEAADGRLVYALAVAERGAPMVVTFTYKPREIGSIRADVALESTSEPRRVTVHQLVYP